MRKSNVQSISEVMGEILQNKRINRGIMENRALNYWEKVLGKSVARVTTRLFIKRGVLYAEINSSVVRNELLMMKDKIIVNLNHAIGSDTVKDIVFR